MSRENGECCRTCRYWTEPGLFAILGYCEKLSNDDLDVDLVVGDKCNALAFAEGIDFASFCTRGTFGCAEWMDDDSHKEDEAHDAAS